eukprot:TRINITY_DN24476_c0_g1_i1.p1 TRINITY_DN24476_c0_g1~~TRINITY_DN24476_c0_g1_i1.p1  ORF type:complete len:626 (+),score=108.42 TRINITY_DN24476_c0_g1_i1:61-1938(+)
MPVSFHERLQSLGAEYDRVVAENAAFRRQFGCDVPRNKSMLFQSTVSPQSTCSSVKGEIEPVFTRPGSNQRNVVHANLVPISDVHEVNDDLFQAILEDIPEPAAQHILPAKWPLQEPHMMPGTPEPGFRKQLADKNNSPRDSGVISVATLPSAGARDSTSMLSAEEIPGASMSKAKSLSAPPAIDQDDDDLAEEAEVPLRQLLVMDIIPAVVIIFNSIVLGVQADVAPDSMVWDVFEILFTLFFIVELVGKTIIVGLRTFYCGAEWYWGFFDLFCVIMALVELVIGYSTPKSAEGGGGIMGIMKMLKLFRLGRVVRLLKFKIFAELKLMVQGVFTGLRVLLWAVVLLMILMYLLAMVGRTLYGAPAGQSPTAQNEFAEFATVFQSWLTMFRCFTEGCADYDGRPLQERLRMSHGGSGVLFVISYILVFLFITIGIFNLIMAVFIDSVNEGSLKKKQRDLGLTAEKTEYILSDMFKAKCISEFRRRKSRKSVHEKEILEQGIECLRTLKRTGTLNESSGAIRKLMERYNVVISQETFTKWLYTDKELIETLSDADIDLSVKFDLFDVLDADLSGELDFGELIDGLMKCRGPVSKNDVIAIRNKVGLLIKMVGKIQEKLCPEAEDNG